VQSLSSWNAKGTTYEEKDVTAWAKDRFKQRVVEAKVVSEGSSNDPKKLLQALESLDVKGASGSPDEAAKMATQLSNITSLLCNMTAKVRSVKEINGEAHMAVVRGTRRFLFDFHATVDWEVTIEDPVANMAAAEAGEKKEEKKSRITGELRLPDVSSAKDSERDVLHDAVITFKKQPAEEHKNAVNKLLEDLKQEVKKKIELFIDDAKST